MVTSDGLAATAEGGDRLASLRALRDRLARELDLCESARDVASLSQRFMDVLEQIEAAEKSKPEKKGTPLDEITKRRAARAKSATGTAQRRV